MNLWIVETKSPWYKIKPSPARDVINLIVANPFMRFSAVQYEYEDEPFDLQILLEETRNPNATICLKDDDYSEAIINLSFWRNSFSLRINQKNLPEFDLEAKTIDYLKEWRGVLPNFAWCVASADDRDEDFWNDVAQVQPLPDCFGSHLGWYHVISPLGYKNYFKRDDLLKTPALKVEELNNRSIVIQSYENPFDFAMDETTERLVEATNYLNEKRLD